MSLLAAAEEEVYDNCMYCEPKFRNLVNGDEVVERGKIPR